MMEGRTARRARGLTGMVLALALVACGDTPPETGTAGGTGREAVRGSSDVEVPDIFQVTEPGLWDGRPSLGGVWVAYPGVEVDQIGQVAIRNQENGRFVIGALFRRERETPGPALQVSSEAADALGLLAGAPATLNVTAVRRGEVEMAAPAADTAEVVAAAPAPAEPLAGADTIAATALPAVSGTQAAPAPTPVSKSTLERPFIQLGIFSIEANARDTATAMEVEGLDAEVVVSESQGSTFWRVIVGPAGTEAARADALERVKALGFTDAYFVRN